MPRSHRPSQIGPHRKDFTAREKEILNLIWSGLTSRQIAQRLGISVKTVEEHRATMMKKIRVSNAAQLLTTAFEQGLIKME